MEKIAESVIPDVSLPVFGRLRRYI
jgi:hypothetical protein